MENESGKKLVPPQEEGKAITAETMVNLKDQQRAMILFNEAKKRLEDVNHWHEIAGGISARFQLVNNNGTVVNRPPEVGDYFRIDIPGPGSVTGDGFDWVRVEDVMQQTLPNSDRYGFRVRPARNPENNDVDIAHFFSADSTSTFVVYREGSEVIAAVYDRNIQPNKDAGNIVDKVRDLMTGSAGMLIFSKLQWKNLTEGVMRTAD